MSEVLTLVIGRVWSFNSPSNWLIIHRSLASNCHAVIE